MGPQMYFIIAIKLKKKVVVSEFKVRLRELKVRLHTAINRVDFVSWCMLYTYEGNKMHS